MKRAALAERKAALTEARLAGLDGPGGAGWAGAGRSDALARLREMGLPHERDEYWKYTKPGALTAEAPAPLPEGRGEAAAFAGVDALRIVFTDGVFDAKASDDLAETGLEIARLGDAASADLPWAAALFGALEAAGHAPVQRPLAAFNTSFASDGIALRATAKIARPVAIEYRRAGAAADPCLHHIIRIEDGAELTLLEDGDGAARLSTGLEVDIADGAAFHHLRVPGRDAGRLNATALFARLGRESTFKSFTLSVGGQLTRNEVVMELTGDDAIAHVAGACLGDGADFHHDDTVFITHDAVNCESRQVFKKVLRNRATGVFQGKILVKEGAQKTDGYQISQSLLLDEDAQFLAKPELEIYADDVACSHGSTSGAIDEEGLFYLRSRGVGEAEAVNLLTLAFMAEALEEVEADDLREIVLERLTHWLGAPA